MINNLENFVSIRWQRFETESITAQLAGLAELVANENGEKDANINSQVKLLEIEEYISKGHDLYFKQQYQGAIDNYKSAQGLIYQALKPAFPFHLTRHPAIEFPFDKGLIAPLLTTSLSYVESMTPRAV